MKKIIVVAEDQSGCSLNRSILPVRHCSDILLKEGIKLELATDIARTEKASAVLVHRVLKPSSLVTLCRMKSEGTRILWDTDDACDLVPQWSPVRYSEEDLDMYKAIQGIADEKWASTDKLGDLIGADRVLPNLLDPELFDLPMNELPPGRRVQILWFGSQTHRGDLLMIEDALRQTLAKYGDKIKLTFWGDAPPALVRDWLGRGVQMMAPVPLGSFYEQLLKLRPDIVLAPLVDHPFNEAKSNLKWLEGSAAGAVTIASHCPAYLDIRDGITGVLASDDGWAEKLSVMIEDVAGRKLIASQSRQWVREQYCWDGSRRESWLDAFRGA